MPSPGDRDRGGPARSSGGDPYGDRRSRRPAGGSWPADSRGGVPEGRRGGAYGGAPQRNARRDEAYQEDRRREPGRQARGADPQWDTRRGEEHRGDRGWERGRGDARVLADEPWGRGRDRSYGRAEPWDRGPAEAYRLDEPWDLEDWYRPRVPPGPRGDRGTSVAARGGREQWTGGSRSRDATGGAEGNERLTGLAGAVLLLLFAAEGVTIVAIRQLLTLHFFIGMLLIGPVILKVGSTLYRFFRYYTGAAEYRRKGPPAPLLRLLGPFVMLLSVTVVGSGVMLALSGPTSFGVWLFVHKASFVLWFLAMTVHVLTYVWRLPRLISADMASGVSRRASAVLAGRPARWLLLAASILTGLALALPVYHRADLWTAFFSGR